MDRSIDNIVYWKKGQNIQNFGDYLSEYFVRYLFFGPAPIKHRFHLIGSVISEDYIISKLQEPVDSAPGGKTVFWGCGLRNKNNLPEALRERAIILAVRGPLSRDALELPNTVPAADPALVLPFIYRPTIDESYENKCVCMPHFHDKRTDEELLSASGCDAIIRPNMTPELREIEKIIDSLFSAKFVLTASLHGAVVAAAYGKPFSYWNNGRIDVPFKWHDFAASISMQTRFLSNIQEGQDYYLRNIEGKILIPPLWPLLAVAPFPVVRGIFHEVIRNDLDKHGEQALYL